MSQHRESKIAAISPANSTSGVNVRAGNPADIPSMMNMERVSATAAHWPEQDYERIFASCSEGGARRWSIVLEERGTINAFIVVASVDSEWELENIVVAAAARRRGFATRLMDEFLQFAQQRGGASVFLEVRESNRPACALYEKWGFRAVGRRCGYYSGPPEDALVYRLELRDESTRGAPEKAQSRID